MSDWVIVRHAVAVAGRVMDGQSEKVIGGARVTITDAPAQFTAWLATRAKQWGSRWERMEERSDRVRTASDGHFHFLDLPDGTYTLTAELPDSGSRYGTAQATVSVSRDAGGRPVIAVAGMGLPPTTVKGQITDQGSAPVVMAEVRVKGSGERVFSDDQGRYIIAGVEAGQRTVTVSARGFQPASQTATLSRAGHVQTLDFTLAEPSP